jgi:hypothetical protein
MRRLGHGNHPSVQISMENEDVTLIMIIGITRAVHEPAEVSGQLLLRR